MAVKVRIARTAGRVLELSDDGGAREFQPHAAALRHARRDGRFYPLPCDGHGRAMHIDQPPIAVDERLNAEGLWRRELKVGTAAPRAASAVKHRASGHSALDETGKGLPIHWA